jgi:hypothetical protein
MNNSRNPLWTGPIPGKLNAVSKHYGYLHFAPYIINNFTHIFSKKILEETLIIDDIDYLDTDENSWTFL